MTAYSFDGSCSDTLTRKQSDSVFIALTGQPTPADLPDNTTAPEIVLWLLRTLGSFISTLILALLHKWFPKWFPDRAIKNYVARRRPPPN